MRISSIKQLRTNNVLPAMVRRAIPMIRTKSYANLQDALNEQPHHVANKVERKTYYLKYDDQFEKYLEEIEDITGRKLHPSQRVELKRYIDEYQYTRLSPEESKEHRKDFNKLKGKIIQAWEEMTGDKFPKYILPIKNHRGNVIRNRGNNFDLHHIIENSYGGNNEAWNMHPAKHPDEHQKGIHRKGGMAEQIFR